MVVYEILFVVGGTALDIFWLLDSLRSLLFIV